MIDIKPKIMFSPEYNVKALFDRPIFALKNLQGFIIDEALDNFNFNIVKVGNTDNDEVIELIEEDDSGNKIKEFQIAPEFMEYTSIVEEKVSFVALEHLNFVFNKANYSKSIVFIQSVQYIFKLENDDLTGFIEKYSTLKTLDHKFFNTNNVDIETISYTNIYNIDNKSYTINIFADKDNNENCKTCEHQDKCRDNNCDNNLTIIIKNKIDKNSKDDLKEEEIKDFIKLSSELINCIGIKT